MASSQTESAVSVPLKAIVALGVEYWRLNDWLDGSTESPSRVAPARYAVRKLGEFLKANEIEAVGLDGRAFDAGLAATVIDSVDDDTLQAGTTVVERTMSPMILHRGQVVKAAEVCTRKGTA